MNKIFSLTSQFKAHEEDDGTVKIRGYASTIAVSYTHLRAHET